MATAATHERKAQQAWRLTQKLLKRNGPAFLTVNQAMYAVGHLLEYHLAIMRMHPSAAPRGVPHADRGGLSRKFLVPAKILSEEEMTLYDRLYASRDTFCEGGIESPEFVRTYVAQAEKLFDKLQSAAKER